MWIASRQITGKLRIFLVAIVSSLSGELAAQNEFGSPRRPPEQFGEAVPMVPRLLFRFPDPKDLADAKSRGTGKLEGMPSDACRSWLQHCVSEDWRPEGEPDFVFIPDEYQEIDCVRLSWERNGCNLEFSQTRTVAAIKITPLNELGTGSEFEDRVRFASKYSRELFPDTGTVFRLNIRGQVWVPVEKMREVIIENSLGVETARELQLDKIVIGLPRPKRPADVEGNDLANSAETLFYWFRNVSWWNDGKSVGYYFPKVEGAESWTPDYGGKLDLKWFQFK
jgi:hypothetical protein